MLRRVSRAFGLRIRRGQTTAEYAIIAALVAICSIAVIMIFGNQIRSVFAAGAKQLAGDTTASPTNEAGNADSAVQKKLDQF